MRPKTRAEYVGNAEPFELPDSPEQEPPAEWSRQHHQLLMQGRIRPPALHKSIARKLDANLRTRLPTPDLKRPETCVALFQWLIDFSELITEWERIHPEHIAAMEEDLLPVFESVLEHTQSISEIMDWWAPEPPPPYKRFAASLRARGQYKATTGGTFVYVARDGDLNVLYIGVSDEIFSRMAQHRRQSKWWPYMRELTWEEWPTREEALAQERRLIKAFTPPYNTVHNRQARRP